jgi:hypothetical protein
MLAAAHDAAWTPVPNVNDPVIQSYGEIDRGDRLQQVVWGEPSVQCRDQRLLIGGLSRDNELPAHPDCKGRGRHQHL